MTKVTLPLAIFLSLGAMETVAFDLRVAAGALLEILEIILSMRLFYMVLYTFVSLNTSNLVKIVVRNQISSCVLR